MSLAMQNVIKESPREDNLVKRTLSDVARKRVAEIGQQLVVLAVEDQITPKEVFEILGYSFGITQTTTSPNSQSTDNQLIRKTQTSKVSSQKRTKKKGTGVSNQPDTRNVKQNNNDSNSSSKKRKNSQPTVSAISKKKRQDGHLTPKERVIPLNNQEVKEKYSLSSCPTSEGLRDGAGKVIEQPQGGPYGLAEWILRSLDTEKGKALLLKRGFKTLDSPYSILRVLFCFIGANSPEDLAHLSRAMPGEQIDKVFSTPFNEGLEYLKTLFEFSSEDLEVLNGYSSFRKSSFKTAWSKAHSNYIKVSSEQTRLLREKVKPKSSDNPSGDVPMDDVNFSEVDDGSDQN